MDIVAEQNKIKTILDLAKSENRSLTEAEITETDNLKAAIAAAKTEAVKAVTEKRSASAASVDGAEKPQDKNTFLRSIAKGGVDVGNKDFIADVVRQFNVTSPLYAAHQNVQKRTNGMAYSFSQVVKGGAGYAKTEGVAGTSDSASAINIATVQFKTYSGQKVLITQEALDDYAADVAQEVVTLGTAKSILQFAVDAVTALESAFLVSTTFTPTQTAATTWALSDLVAQMYEVPIRNRGGAKWIGNSATIKAIVGVLANTNDPQREWINFSPDNIIEDDAIPTDVLFYANPTLALAVGIKDPIRVVTLQVSEGVTYEVQPRMAVALRDGTAVSVRYRKQS